MSLILKVLKWKQKTLNELSESNSDWSDHVTVVIFDQIS